MIENFDSLRVKDKILKALLTTLSDGNPVSGESLARRFKVSRADINKHIKKLKALGYKITARPHSGYIMSGLPTEINFDNLELFVEDVSFPPIAIKHYKKTDSTQLRAKDFALKKNMDDSYGWRVFVSEEQTDGYGRMRREWISTKGGLWFSVLMPEPAFPPHRAPAFSLVFSLAVRSALEEIASLENRFYLKWPNDIMVFINKEKKYKKVGGIIIEMSSETQEIQWLVSGCGINLSNRIPAEISDIAANIKSITDKEINPASLLKEIIIKMRDVYRTFCEEGFGGLLKKEYEKYDVLRGKEITISSPDGEISGIAQGVDEDGHLIISQNNADKSCALRKVFAGDVTVKKIR